MAAHCWSVASQLAAQRRFYLAALSAHEEAKWKAQSSSCRRVHLRRLIGRRLGQSTGRTTRTGPAHFQSTTLATRAQLQKLLRSARTKGAL